MPLDPFKVPTICGERIKRKGRWGISICGRPAKNLCTLPAMRCTITGYRCNKHAEQYPVLSRKPKDK